MSVIAVCGLPGTGKSLFTTYLARKHYKRLNRFNFKAKKNYVYSNYPIKLDRKHYSKSISLDDLALKTSWNPGSVIILDEVQLYFDSLDFKDFPKAVRNTFQLHRHFGISNIYINSQHPTRIVKQLRVLACEIYDIVGFIKIPFTPFAIFLYNIYYNADDFGKSVKVKKADVSYKFARRFKIINYRKVYKSYDTCYMSELVADKPVYDSPEFNKEVMSLNEIQDTFNISNESVKKPLKKKPNVEVKSIRESVQPVKNETPVIDSTPPKEVANLSDIVEEIKLSNDKGTLSSDQPDILVEKSDDFAKLSPADSKPVDDPIALIDEIYSSQNSNEVSQNNSGGFWG